MPRFSALVTSTILVSALLAGCSFPLLQPDTGSVQTAAVLTVQAQLTADAPVATSTTAPFPTLPAATAPIPTLAAPPSATSTSTCDGAQFIADITIPDDTVMTQGQTFTKTWRLKNVGTCSWTPSYAVIFVSGESMSGPAVQALTGNVNPGQTVDVAVDLKSPNSNGSYAGYWKLRNGSGVAFSQFYVKIKVQGGGGGPFAVLHVTYDLATFDEPGYTGCPIVTAHIQSNGAGDVQYHWVRSDGPESVQTLHFNSAQTKDISEKWYLGSAATGTQSLGIYVDDPNNQDFGHININKCTMP